MGPHAAEPLILIADDDASDRELTRRLLEDSGVPSRILEFPGGLAVMNYLQRWLAVEKGDWIARSLLLLDLRMPATSGFQVLEWVRHQARLRTMYVIVITHSSSTHDRDEAVRLGANECLEKRDGRAILEALHRLTGRAVKA